MADTDQVRSLEVRAFEVVIALLQAMSLGLAGWMLITIVAHGERLTAIEANRFTSTDALEFERVNAESTQP